MIITPGLIGWGFVENYSSLAEIIDSNGREVC